MPNMSIFEKANAFIIEPIKAHLKQVITPIQERITLLEKKLEEGIDTQAIIKQVNEAITIPADGEKGEQGPSGEKGEIGLSAYQIVQLDGFLGTEADWLASLKGIDGQDGAHGIDGKSAYAIALENGFTGSEQEWLESLKGEQGITGKEGASAYQLALNDGYTGSLQEWLTSLKGIDGQDGSHGIDGKSAYELACEKGYKGSVSDWLDLLKGINGKDGINGKSAYEIACDKGFTGSETDWLVSLKGNKGIDGKDGRDGRDGKDGRDGINGQDGKDSLDLDILPSIDETKSYPRGTFASHHGGIWKATRNTDGMDGWLCLIEGIKQITINYDGTRGLTLEIAKSSTSITQSFNMPVMIYQGIYKSDNQYQQGDTVTWGGSLWHCNTDTTDKPGESKAWVLCAKKGRDGKDGEKGDKGEKGSNGKDLTKPTINSGSW